MSVSSTDKELLAPDNCAVIFIDHEAQMFFGVANMDRQDLLNNVLVLGKAAKIFGVPVILTAVEAKGFSGNITPQLLELFADQTPIERSSMNAWDSNEFIAAVKKTGRKNVILAALWSEVCLAMPALPALTDGYAVYAVVDASGGASAVAHDAAIRRIEQAGGVSMTALQVLLELQRDWARKERGHGGREGALRRLRPGRRKLRHDGSQSSGQPEALRMTTLSHQGCCWSAPCTKRTTLITMKRMTNLILPKGTTPRQPAFLIRYNGRQNGECNLVAERHFQLLTEWRNDDDDGGHRVSEPVISAKKCLTTQRLPVADQSSHIGLRVPSTAEMGPGGRRQGGLTNCHPTKQREFALVFFQSFEGSVRSDSSRRSS